MTSVKDMIKSTIKMLLVAHPETILDEQRALKEKTCELILRAYILDATMRGSKPIKPMAKGFYATG